QENDQHGDRDRAAARRGLHRSANDPVAVERLCELPLGVSLNPLTQENLGALLDLGLEWRERALVAVERELEQPLVLDVLQLRLAEVEHACALGKVVPDQRPRRLGDENLASVAGGADPRGADDIEPEVPLL